MKRAVVCTLLAVAGLAGCAEVSFKRGASPTTMAAAEQACRALAADLATYRACMRDRGWFIAGAPDERAEVADGTAGDTEEAAEDVANDVGAMAAVGIDNQATAEDLASTTVASTKAESTKAAPPDAASKSIKVMSWWKFGGNAAGLDSDRAACAKVLGPDHQPESGAHWVSTPLRECLRSKGWYGLGG